MRPVKVGGVDRTRSAPSESREARGEFGEFVERHHVVSRPGAVDQVGLAGLLGLRIACSIDRIGARPRPPASSSTGRCA